MFARTRLGNSTTPPRVPLGLSTVVNPSAFRSRRFIATLALLLCALPLAGALAQSRNSEPHREVPAAELLQELRKGGYILYFRHTATDFSKNDDAMTSFEDCASQRNLTEAGRAQARAVGEAIRALAIPVGKVLASPYCRTVETGMLIFGRAEKSGDVRGGPGTATSPARYAGLRKLLSTRPPAGSNLAIASHGNPFHAVAGPPYLTEGEAAVVRPLGEDFEIVARIHSARWSELQPTR
jgi:histidine phosphatase superfamily protein (branch 1)